jgi:DNA-binding SARP family transcriptional activator/tetratricopeptide (TPR) repeat protein
MEAPRYLRCIGYPTLYSPTGEPVRFRTKKHLALLAFLALECRQTHRRDHLAEMLWPSVPVAEARHSLATALSVLRPRVGIEVIQATRDQVVFTPGRVAVDVERLFADESDQVPLDDIEIAGFLDGFEISDAREFALWKDRMQARLLPRLTSIFALLVDRCRKHGNTRRIEYLANRMLALDELCEEAVRAKMEVLALTGDRLAALRLYEEWRHKVEEELSASPSEPLAAIATQLRKRGWERAPIADIPGPTTDLRRGSAFIGRTAEYKVLYEAWEFVRTHHRAHIMVLGDSGVGKTTLVDRFTAAASFEGAAVSRVQCYDLEREIPYSTVAGLVVGLLDCQEILGTPPEALAELSRIVPQLRQRFSAIPVPKDTHGETARIELTEALHEFLEALTEVTPVILVVDDLHLADEASLAVLHLLLRRALDQRTMLVMIARPGELSLGSQGRLFRDFAALLGIREIKVQPLSDEESTELLTELLRKESVDPPKHVKNALLQAAAGYPMVLELLVQDWRANGANALGLAIDAMTIDLHPEGCHTATYERALSRITCSVDPATRTIIYLASILGSRLNDLAMYSLANLSLGQTMAGLAQLTDLRVLRDGTRGLEFVNELVRAHIYASIPSTVRRALHGAIADRLLSEEGTQAQSSGLEVAWHCLRAGRPDQATPHLLRGARQAMGQGAPYVAERALDSARPTLTPTESPKVSLLLAEAMQEQGRWRESLDVLADLPGSDSRDVRWWTTVLAAVARRNLGASLTEETRADIPLLTTILRESPDGRTRVAAARAVAHFASIDRDASAAGSLLPLIGNIPYETLDDDTQGQLALTRGLLLWLTGNVAESYEVVQQAVESLQRKRVENTVAVQLTLGLGTLRMHEGRYADALSHYERASKMARRLGNDTQLASILGNLAMCHGRLGNYTEQLHFTLAAPRTWGAEFGGLVELQLAYCHALSLIMLGRSGEALAVINRLDDRLHGPLPNWMRQGWSLWKADLLLCSGNHTEASEAAAQVVREPGSTLHSAGFAGPFARWISHLSKIGGPDRAVKRTIQNLLPLLGTYDALDQVEVLCAAQAMEVTGNGQGRGYDDLIQERLRRLPSEVASHLKRVGSLA